MEKVVVTIKGMTCGHCIMSVTEELEAAGATEVAIDLVKGGLSTAQVGSAQPLSDTAITDAVSEAGYEVESISRYMLIRVADTFEVRLQPERGTVLLRVQAEGSDKSEVTTAATNALSDLTLRVHQLLNPGSGPITAFNQGQVSNSAHRPWHERGKQLPFIYTTTCTMSARFNDFGALFRFIEEVTTLPDVEVQGVSWELTKRTEELAQADAQTEVVRRVTEKAMRLASAAGATEIVPTIIADPGLLTERGGGSFESYPMAVGARTMMAMDAGGGSGLVFQPEEIVIRASVEAEYEAS